MSEAGALEAQLGDPASAGPFSRDAVLGLDEREAFPEDACAALAAFSYFEGLVPVEHGGTLHAFDRFAALARVVARRDLTASVSTTQSLLSALPVLVGGDETQKALVVARLRRGEPGALGLTEEAHGAELLSIRARARREGDGYVLDGHKWGIPNGTRAFFRTLLVRTEEQGPRSLSLFLLDGDAHGLRTTPRLRTHGIRGADVSGLVLEAARVPESARIGREGDGLSLVLTTMQVSRTLASVHALGAADTALRLAMDFALTPSRGGLPWDVPSVRSALRRAFVSVLVADALALFAARALSHLPDQMSVLSAVTKVAVAELALDAITRLAPVLGEHCYVRDGRYGLFQKMQRDAPVVALVDGSAAVNRAIVASQLAELVGARLDDASLRRLARCASLTEVSPRFRTSNLQATSRGADDVLAGLSDAVARLAETASAGVCLRLDALTLTYADLVSDVRSAPPGDTRTGAFLALAERYVVLATAAVLVHVHAGASALTPENDALLALGLDTLLTGLGVRHAHPDDVPHAALVDARLLALSRTGQLYSHMPFSLAESLARGATPTVE